MHFRSEGLNSMVLIVHMSKFHKVGELKGKCYGNKMLKNFLFLQEFK